MSANIRSRMFALRLLFGIFLSSYAAPAFAGAAGAGTGGAAFLKIAPGARPSAMGEAFSAVADDAHAIYYDPAGLARVAKAEATGMHDARLQGMRYEFAALALPLASRRDPFVSPTSRGTLALAIYDLSIGGMERRSTTETDAPVGTFGSTDLAYSVGYGISLASSVSVGAAVKLIDQTLDAERATAVALDAGTIWTLRRLRLAAGLRNFGTAPKFRDAADPLPLTFYGGLAAPIGSAGLVAADARLPRDEAASFSLGAEYSRAFGEGVRGWLRGGFNSARADAGGLSGLSLGGGVGFGALRLDIAWVPYGDLGNTFRYSLMVRF